MDVEWIETGTPTGPALLFLPGSYSSARAWMPIMEALPDRYRKIAISLPGYGGTPETRVRGDDLGCVLSLLDHVVERINAPVHVIGHSYGGAMALALALLGKTRPASLVMIEAIPMCLHHNGAVLPFVSHTQDLITDFDALRATDPVAAAQRMIHYWSGPNTLSQLPDGFVEYCGLLVDNNRWDWDCVTQLTTEFSDVKALNIPVTVARSEFANEAMLNLTAAFKRHADLTPHIIAGADHFLLGSHAQACAALIDKHMDAT